MASSEIIKNALINEIEENLSQNTNSIIKTKIIDSVSSSLAERDNYVTKEALEIAGKYGIDPSYRNWSETSTLKSGSSNTISHFSSPDKTSYNTTSLKEQLGSLLSSLDPLDIEGFSREEEDDDITEMWSTLDKVRALNIPKAHFEHFLQSIKIHRPNLYYAIHQHSLFNAFAKQKKKKSRRDKKRERKERRLMEISTENVDSSLKPFSDDLFADSESISTISKPDENPAFPIHERKRETNMSIFVAKCISEGTMQSFLIAILYLIHVWNTESNVNEATLQLTNVISSVLGLQTPVKETVSKNVLTKKNLSFRAETISDSGNKAQSSIDEISQVEDAVSQIDSLFHSGFSETGSTIGSMLGSVSVEVGNEIHVSEYDLSEEEMLSQALAMSLVTDVTPVIKEILPEPSSSPAPSLYDAKLSNLKEKNVSMETDQSPGSMKVCNEKNTSPKSRIDPLSTFGPLDSSLVVFDDIDLQPSSSNISIKSVIVALLITVSANCNRIMNEDPSPELISHPDSHETINNKQFDWNSKPILELIPQPSFTSFQVIEYIIELLVDKLSREFKFSSNSLSKSKDSVQTLVWCLIAALRIFRGHLFLTELFGSTSSMLSTGLASEIALAMSYSNVPVMPGSASLTERLTSHIVGLMSLDTFRIESKSNPLSLVFQFSPLLGNSGVEVLNLSYMHHGLRKEALSTFVTGFKVFCPNEKDRECIMRNLLTTSTTSNEFENLTLYSYPKLKEFSEDYYNILLLQMLCIAESKNGNSPYLDSCAISNDISNDTDVNHINIGSQTESKIQFVHSPFTPEDNAKFGTSIESVIMRRLKLSAIQSREKTGDLTDNSLATSKETCLYYGELILLTTYQLQCVRKLIDSAGQNDPVAYPLRFDSKNSSSSLSFYDDDRNVSHKGPKMWISVTTQKGIAPCTGIHELLFRIDKCDRGQVFIGLTLGDTLNSLRESHFLGCDESSWSLLGDGTLWHNRVKVRSDYGININNRALIKMRYDSNVGTLSFSFGDSVWGVAFANLPKRTLFPGVTLHDKDDKVSILGWNQVSDDSKMRDYKSKNVLSETSGKNNVINFVKYTQSLFSIAEELIREVESASGSKKLLLLSHPFFGVLIPALMSSILTFSLKQSYQALFSFQILPYFIVYTKRLYSIFESISETNSPFTSNYTLIGGLWKFKSSGSSSTLPSQEYCIQITTPQYQRVTASDGRGASSVVKVTGSGIVGSKSASLVGTQSGLWLKFIEDWGPGGYCIVDGRLSICGTYFTGKYLDPKTGKGGSMSGMLLTPQSSLNQPDNIKNNIGKALTLSTQCCGKIIGCFVLGMQFKEDMNVKQNSDSEKDLAKESNADSLSESELTTEINKWVQSRLFSSGFPVDEDFLVKFTQDLCYLFPSSLESSLEISSKSPVSWKSFGECEESNSVCQGLMNWWMQKVFPDILGQSVVSLEAKSDSASIVTEIKTGTGPGAQLDEYVLHHCGPSVLLKVGGEPMIVARRLIIAALITHSGTSTLCCAELNCLQKGLKNHEDNRPHPILIEVWKAGQRIVENLIRQRQKTGFTYAAISKSICAKADLLLRLTVSDATVAVHDSLSMVATELVLKDTVSQNESDSDLQKDCVGLISDVVEFLMSPVRNVDDILAKVYENTVKALSRIAGLKSILVLIEKVGDISISNKTVPLSPITSLSLQPILMELLMLSLHGYSDYYSTVGKSWSTISSIRPDSNGHYMSDLNGLNSAVRKTLKMSFERVFEINTQLLSRCTWYGDREGQFSALCAWGISISPSDHVFLNRIGIFRVLQTVLDDVRAATSELTQNHGKVDLSARDADVVSLIKADIEKGPYSPYMLSSSIKRLSQLALKVVHSLASQVAFTKDPTSNLSQVAAPKLIRMPSGPDTLSASLFEMLYSELFSGLKRIVSTFLNSMPLYNESDAAPVEPKPTPSSSESNDEYALDGEQHIDRILKLLFFVSTSKSCHKALSSAKWLSLLVSTIGCGPLPIQRRIFRLLRRIVSNMTPHSFKAYVPSFFSAREEFLSSETPLNDEELESLSENLDEKDSELDLALYASESQLASPADRLIIFLLEAMSVISLTEEITPLSTVSEKMKKSFFTNFRNIKLSGFISAEALVFLRVLLGIPTWRSQMLTLFSRILDNAVSSNQTSLKPESWNSSRFLSLLTSSCGVCGGYIDRLRPGGIVTLKPFTLASMADSFANKLASTIHNTGMLVGMSDNSDSVEIVFMERGLRFVKPEPSDTLADPNEKTIHFTTSVNGSLPVRAVRLTKSDVLPSYDVSFLPDIISKSYFSGLINIIKLDIVPWVVKYFDNHKPSMTASSNSRGLSNSRSRISRDSDQRDHESPGDSENEDNGEDDIVVESEEDEEDADRDEEFDDMQRLIDGDGVITHEPSTNVSSDRDSSNDLQEAFKLHLRVASLRSFSTTLLNEAMAAEFVDNQLPLFEELLRLSIVETQCGGLNIIESAEEKWSTFWDAYGVASLSSNTSKPAPAVQAAAKPTASRAILSEDHELISQLRREAEERIGSSEPSSNPFAPFLLGRSVDPAARAEAISQMMDMGLPREWCETSLRRCRYNIEMAINMCFEHGEDMARFVAEDAAILAVQSSRERERDRDNSWRRRPAVLEDQLSSAVPAGLSTIASLTRALTRSRAYRQENPDTMSSVRQLVDMGFPPSWCDRAMEETNNDVSGALAWILSRGEDLATMGPTSTIETVKPAKEVPDEESDSFIPLESVSGASLITPDLICSVAEDGFPSVGCRGFAASKGKWYFEVTLLSSGCIQIGWVDSAYTGGADSGVGVGDDIHSWAFDGWRTFLWHEISTPWGARWSTGDIVCCSIDIDNRIMSFGLNGFNREIEMGVAFTDFTFKGGMYPCASFNKREKIQFNFGATPFKFPIPHGFMSFQHHINNVRNQNMNLSRVLKNDIFRNILTGSYSKANSDSQKHLPASIFEDAMEESIGEKQINPLRRYFPEESGRIIGSDRNAKLPTATVQSVAITDQAGLFAQLSTLSKDLCILYSRQSVLRLFQLFPRLSETSKLNVVELFSKIDSSFAESVLRFSLPSLNKNETVSATSFETLTLLFRICGIHTSRTKIYLHTLSLSPASVTPHHFLGSFASVGGAPFYDALRGAMVALLRHSRQDPKNNHIVEVLIENLYLDCVSTIRREQSFDSRAEGGLSPVQNGVDNVVSNSSILSTNSLTMATWITGILIDQFAHEIANCSSSSREIILSDIAHWYSLITESWSISLRSPSILVKTCACQVLSGLIQEHSYSSHRFSALPKSSVATIISKIPSERLKSLVIERLNLERAYHPIYTEYLQGLVELFVSLSHCSVYVSAGGENSLHSQIVDEYSVDVPQMESSFDVHSPNFNWEACSGRVFSDTDSLVVWTGTIIQKETSNLPSADRKVTERTEFPPELLIGCRVSRKVKNPPPPPPAGDELIGLASTEGPESNEPVLPTPESESVSEIVSMRNEEESHPGRRFFERLAATSQAIKELGLRASEDSGKEAPSTPDQIEYGTVTGISEWEDDLPGTARIIEWDNGTTEKIRWGASGRIYDVTHVKVVNSKVSGDYVRPVYRDSMAVNQSFGSKATFGVIFRLRQVDLVEKSEIYKSKLIGLMEWPDFNSVVFVEGYVNNNDSWILTEKKLVSGPSSANWAVRFGDNNWRPGTTYSLTPASSETSTSFESCKVMQGSYDYTVTIPFINTRIVGDISIQRSRLFIFDEKFHSSNVTLSWDRLSITKSNSGSGQGSAFGTVGFSTGVHYWEFKVEQADVGSVFIGVSEKPGPPGLTPNSKCSRWMGCGFVSHRASYRAASTTASERVAVYGDYFVTGDLIGVLLDMNRGRLSFFLDGMKYGEHTLADLGEAFDGLATPLRVKPKVLYPVVGLSRHQDRVTITPRWLSSVGSHPLEELRLISRAWRLLASWSIDRPSNRPSDMNLWAYRDAWRDWRRWLSGRYIRIRTRTKTAALLLDISPEACVKASIRLGLPTALFHGDRVSFEKSSGRKLEVKEEAVILGVYQGRIWFRYDSQQNSTSLSESGSVAWCLAPHDIEGLTIIRRSMIRSPFVIPAEIINIDLPRIKEFRGGIVTLTLSSGAAMRNGLEIDTSDMIREIAANTVLYSIESRMNCSNIIRHKVYYNGAIGWISERMRGGAEEVIITRHSNVSEEEIMKMRGDIVEKALEIGASDKIVWDDVDTLDEAIALWRTKITKLGYSHLLENGGILSTNPIAVYPPSNESSDPFCFENYISLATTIDGKRNWIVEADMQLAECLTKTAAKDGVTPQNLSCHSLTNAIKSIDNASSQLYHIDPDRAIARAALLRVANQVIGYALPFMDFSLIEERIRRDVSGSDDEIEISCTNLPSAPEVSSSAASTDPIDLNAHTNKSYWLPPSWARRMRSMRRVLFGQTKRQFWESVIEFTTTATPMHQDEYEDPREIKTISINRIKATPSKLVTFSSVHDRLKQSVFGQLHKEIKGWSDASFRRCYVGKGHGGQKRSFKVKFLGEGVNDYGGPYRAVFEQVIDELQCDRSVKSSEKSLLPLLIPSNNRCASVGSIQDKFVLSTSPTTSPAILELMHFFGKLLGSAVRQNLNLALDLSAMVWRPLVRLPVSRAHLETVDSLLVKSLDEITKKGILLEQDPVNYPPSYVPEEWEDINFMIYLPDGSRVPLMPGGEDHPVNVGNWRLYVTLTERCRLRESVVMLKALRDGLSTVLPVDILPLFTPNEFEQIICGSSNVDIGLLKQCTEYEDVAPDSDLVKNFWEVLEEFTPEERTLFLRFVWARSRMPSSAEDLLMNFKLQMAQGDARSKADQYLPHAQTCFFSLSLPPYSSKEILKEKLLYAIHNSPNMDADVRLHHADGWADA